MLTVFGNDFNASSVVRLHSAGGQIQVLPSYFVNTGLLMAAVPANTLVKPTGLNIDVANYSTQSSSNLVALEVEASGSSGSGSSGSGSGSSGSGSGSSGSGSSGGGTTSPAGSPMLVTVTSPAANAAVAGAVTVKASAKQTKNTDGSINTWAIYNGSNLVWVDENADTSISVPLALSKGAHTLKVVAFDDAWNPSTAAVPVSSTASGITTSWHACMHASSGQKYQAMQISPQHQLTGVLQSQMFTGPNCKPEEWTDQMNDVGQTMTFGAGSSYTFWFIHRANQANVSAVWTMGNQSSGCVNYSSVPPC